MNDKFQIVGAQTAVQAETKAAKRYFKNVPWLSIIVLGLIFAGCFMYRFLLTKDPAYMDFCTVPWRLTGNFSLVQIRWAEIFFL